MNEDYQKLRTVLFDLDGTLADTAEDLADALNGVRDQRGLQPLSFDLIRPVVSHGADALIYLSFEVSPGGDDYAKIREDLLDIYRNNIANKTRLFPGMAEVLESIENSGRNWGVVTNKPSWLTEPLIKALNLDERAACIVSGDTTPKRKPDPQPMLYASNAAGSHSYECLYIGDAERDIEAGRRAGMKTLAALFGYIGEKDNPDAWGADGMISQPSEILNWLHDQPTKLDGKV